MRTQNIQNMLTLEYPDQIAQINDDNVLVLSSLTNKAVGARLTLSNSDQDTVALEYDSELTTIVFKLWDTLKYLVKGQHSLITVSGDVSNDGILYHIDPVSFYVELGRTMNSRTAGNVRTMYWSSQEDLSKVNIYSPTDGTASVGQSQYTLAAGVNVLDLSSLQLGGDFQIDVALSYPHSQTMVQFGDLWHHSVSGVQPNTRYSVSMLHVASGADCNPSRPSNYGKVRFINADGCWVVFIGKVTKEKFAAEYIDYWSDSITVRTPHALVTDATDEVTVYFQDTAYDSYLTDIVWATRIEYLNGAGEWKECTLSSKSVQIEDGDGNNVELVLKVLA